MTALLSPARRPPGVTGGTFAGAYPAEVAARAFDTVGVGTGVATASANDATVANFPVVQVPGGTTAVDAKANAAAVITAHSALAGTALSQSLAYDATATSLTNPAPAESTTATADAADPTVSVVQDASPAAQSTTATSTANNATPSTIVSATAEGTAADAKANDATGSTAIFVSATAQSTTATSTGNDATVKIATTAGAALADAKANDAFGQVLNLPAPNSTDWQVNGVAVFTGTGDEVKLTPATNGQVGDVVYKTSTIDLTSPVRVNFDTEMSGGGGADGIALIFFDAGFTSASSIGNGGSDHGFGPLKGAALQLQDFSSAAIWARRGADGVNVTEQTKSDASLRGTHTWQVTLQPTATPGVVDVTALKDGAAWVVWPGVHVPLIARLAFGAGTGGLTDNHYVRNVSGTVTAAGEAVSTVATGASVNPARANDVTATVGPRPEAENVLATVVGNNTAVVTSASPVAEVARADAKAVGTGPGFADWTLEEDNALTATTGLTTSGGTWSVSGGQVQVVTGASTNRRAVDVTELSNPAVFVAEVEFEVPASWGSGAAGVLVTDGFAGTNGYLFRVNQSGSVEMQRESTTSLGTVSYSVPSAGTWVKLRLVVIGQDALGFIDGVLVYTGNGFGGLDHGNAFPGLFAGGAAFTVRFRNLKAWSADLAQPS